MYVCLCVSLLNFEWSVSSALWIWAAHQSCAAQVFATNTQPLGGVFKGVFSILNAVTRKKRCSMCVGMKINSAQQMAFNYFFASVSQICHFVFGVKFTIAALVIPLHARRLKSLTLCPTITIKAQLYWHPILLRTSNGRVSSLPLLFNLDYCYNENLVHPRNLQSGSLSMRSTYSSHSYTS